MFTPNDVKKPHAQVVAAIEAQVLSKKPLLQKLIEQKIQAYSREYRGGTVCIEANVNDFRLYLDKDFTDKHRDYGKFIEVALLDVLWEIVDPYGWNVTTGTNRSFATFIFTEKEEED